MIKRPLLLLLLASILFRGISAEACAVPADDGLFREIMEQQPIVKCIDLFSDVSMQITQKWFVVVQTPVSRAADNGKKRAGGPGGSKDCTIAGAAEQTAPKAVRTAGSGWCSAVHARITFSGAFAELSLAHEVAQGYGYILLYLLLMTILAHGGIGGVNRIRHYCIACI